MSWKPVLQGIFLIYKQQRNKSFIAGFQETEKQNAFSDNYNSKIACAIQHLLI